MWIKRQIEDVLPAIAAQRPAIILTGCRQAGKTSLLKHVFPQLAYVSLDLPHVAEAAETSGAAFLTQHPPPLIIDEVQYAPNSLRWLKKDIDDHREKNGRFLITGSQKFPLMPGITESLAGRCSILQCHSLSAREYENWRGQTIEGDRLLAWMYQGGYPELHAKELPAELFFSDYLATYLERDVRQALQVRSLRDFDRFMRLCATRTGQLFSYSALAADIGVSPNTIKNWISVLEASNIIYLLEPFYRNLGKRIIKSPKLYFLDTGLACFLLGMRTVQDLRHSNMIGPLFETHVLGQIVRYCANRAKNIPLYFYRDHYGHEVDFVIPVGNALKLIECKWSETLPDRIKGFDEIINLVGKNQVLAQIVINQTRGHRMNSSGVVIQDSIDLQFLD